MSFRKYSACARDPRHGGDLGWQQEEHFHPDFANAVKVMHQWIR